MFQLMKRTFQPMKRTFQLMKHTFHRLEQRTQQQKNFSAVVKKQIYSYRTRNLPAETEQHNSIGRNIHA